ncbi:OLC1v1018965C1 [Oldenlandia corymbosa var. corymbosa]|uniref:protein-histidine N-methyltransferase n=1 Tax=Oldenlandia corymbosa var. corymbosa TaxID=529605 RepID=A0AAV1ECX6_OLDCO|nr:OLC1v1018965C1 [Oldenlandia corymbosa var. corymbosa]
MEAGKSNSSNYETFRLFDGNPQTGFGLDFQQSSGKSVPPPPPCLEVIPSQELPSVKYTVETVNLDGIALLKGRVNTKEVFKFSNLDLVPGKYEGGLKLWEGSLDLVKTLSREMQEGKLSFTGKRVLELGCGHGLPGIFACLKGSSCVHFQDFNAEVLQSLTIPNVNANIQTTSQTLETNVTRCNNDLETRYFAGDWGEVHQILPYIYVEDSGKNPDEKAVTTMGYDIILMAETVYAIYTFPTLYDLIKKSLNRPNGVVYMAAKKYYFGVGGGSRKFVSFVEKDGVMSAELVAEVADGSSNVREVWKFHFK